MEPSQNITLRGGHSSNSLGAGYMEIYMARCTKNFNWNWWECGRWSNSGTVRRPPGGLRRGKADKPIKFLFHKPNDPCTHSICVNLPCLFVTKILTGLTALPRLNLTVGLLTTFQWSHVNFHVAYPNPNPSIPITIMPFTLLQALSGHIKFIP